jgi:glycosyltransferase involved in cell wall biosynthesis
MEAMACGLPVVATAVGDVPEMVEHGLTGYVVGTDDEEGAARHLLELMQHAGTRESMGRRARSFIQEHHALDALSGQLARLYSERFA